jgi:methionyl-tRNA formyltransferase
MPDRTYRVDGPVCLLIGSGEMPVQAAHSPDAPLRQWAEVHNPAAWFQDFALFKTWGETIAYDYLFSVRNLRILPSSLITFPQLFAVNFHDAPLPKYAGSHACAWALKNGEQTHGISWHVMTEEVDGGDLLKQVTFPIAAGTSLGSLQQRCYLAAMRSFRELLTELKTETYTRTPQDLSQRTYYAKASRGHVLD